MARRKKKRKPRKQPRRFLKWTAIALATFVAASITLVLPLRWLDPFTTMFMLRDDSGIEPILHEWVSWENMGTTAPLAVIGAEDQRFADHYGLDLKAIRRALDEQDERGYLRGASTITQQTVKNLYLWSGRSFLRKGLEAWLALVAELCLPKRRILEIYLNIAEFGPGIYGIGAASDFFFGRTPKSLTDQQAASLASVLPNPRQYQVNIPTEQLRERRAWILKQTQRLKRQAWLTRID